MSIESGEARPAAELRLVSEPRSVSAARRFLRSLLVEADREQWVDSAELALSEVVTNGVLHAHTDLVVRVRLMTDLVEVEVADANPTLPMQRSAQESVATTGRGLGLVAAVARDFGVRAEAGGKVVWFTVGDDEPAQEPTEQELLTSWDVDGDLDDGADDGADEPAVREVVLRDLPTTLWMAAREHHHALLRELVLYLAEHEQALEQPPDMARADQARNLIWAALTAEVDRAREAGVARRPLPDGHPSPLPEVPDAVDLRLTVALDGGDAFGAMQDALDLGEQLAVADRLLVRPGLPEIIAVRDWACEQVVAQLAGVPASPWPGTDQSRFTDLVHDRETPQAPVWDDALVTASDRGVVAADDANRIIAVSEPLARAVGWDPSDLVGRRVVALIPPALREGHVAGFSRHLTTGETHILGVPLTLPVLHRDGRELPCSFLVERAEVGAGRPVYLAWIEPVED